METEHKLTYELQTKHVYRSTVYYNTRSEFLKLYLTVLTQSEYAAHAWKVQ
jgi:hypothetical protein